MSTIEDISNLFFRITPSFRAARKKRDEIKSKYRKNIRNMKSGKDVELVRDIDTRVLGDNIEPLHSDLEARILKIGERHPNNSPHQKQARAVDTLTSYEIPKEHKDNLIKTMKDIISKIEWKNRISYLLEFVTYVVIVFLVFSFIYLL